MKRILIGLSIGFLFIGRGVVADASPITFEMTGIIDDTWNGGYIEAWVNLKIGDEFQGTFIYDDIGAGFSSINFKFNNVVNTVGDTRRFVGFDTSSPSWAMVGSMAVTPTSEGAQVDGSSSIGFNEWDATQTFDKLYGTTGDLHLLFSANGGDYASMNLAFTISDSPTPVPEPATKFLFGTGIAGLAVIRRRRRKR